MFEFLGRSGVERAGIGVWGGGCCREGCILNCFLYFIFCCVCGSRQVKRVDFRPFLRLRQCLRRFY